MAKYHFLIGLIQWITKKKEIRFLEREIGRKNRRESGILVRAAPTQLFRKKSLVINDFYNMWDPKNLRNCAIIIS